MFLDGIGPAGFDDYWSRCGLKQFQMRLGGLRHGGERHRTIESHQATAMVHRQCQQIDIGQLA